MVDGGEIRNVTENIEKPLGNRLKNTGSLIDAGDLPDED